MHPREAAGAPTFLLFSGHNERAAIALCRFFAAAGLDALIVASGPSDAIHRTVHADRVLINRVDRRVDVTLFAAAVEAADRALVYVPTTEFINQFVLDHRAAVETAGVHVGLPAAEVYARLTGKFASQQLVHALCGLAPPSMGNLDEACAPCVLKPRENIVGAAVLYPRLCLSDTTLKSARRGLDPDLWFAQHYVEGQSHYLCGYLARSGTRAWYWQDNLLQQPDGKSIVLARTGRDPGVDADALFDGLAAIGYHGPFMLELIRDREGALHYIEINPRFWGPLQLALDACPRLLTLFARDHGAAVAEPAPPAAGPHWYAWAHGARLRPHRVYPLADDLGPPAARALLLKHHDVYARDDTRALHGNH